MHADGKHLKSVFYPPFQPSSAFYSCVQGSLQSRVKPHWLQMILQ